MHQPSTQLGGEAGLEQASRKDTKGVRVVPEHVVDAARDLILLFQADTQ